MANRSPTTRRKAHAPPSLVRADGDLVVRFGAVEAVAAPEGALWIPDARALIVADLHFEKASAFAKSGQLLPPYDTSLTIARLAALIALRNPDLVVSLGDAFHDGGGSGRMHYEERQALQTLVANLDWVWIEGNHDGASAQTLGGVVRSELRLGPLILRHEPIGEDGEIAGHLHPCAKVAGRGRNLRRRCFAYDGSRMVLPAFGAYTGGLNVCDAAFAKIFPAGLHALVLGRDKVMPVACSRLLAD